MGYTDLIFDLYGTLVDIHTEETDAVWEKTALYLGFYGAHCTGAQLKTAFRAALAQREARAGADYECFPDIPFEEVLAQLLEQWGIREDTRSIGFHAAQVFRILSIDYIRRYPCVVEALEKLRAAGCRLWLLSNAQRSFTAYELRLLKLDTCFDGIYISSDYGCRKPDLRFYRALLEERQLDVRSCLMIGNDRATDIAGAMAAGLDTLYMHTALTPADQGAADPARAPGKGIRHMEFEGDDWQELGKILLEIVGNAKETPSDAERSAL